MPYEKSSTLPRGVLFFSFLTGSLIGVTELYASRHHVMRRRWSIPIPVTGHRYAIAHDVTKPDASSSSWRRSVLNVEAVFARRSYYTCLRLLLFKHAQLQHICSTKILTMARWTFLNFVQDQWTPIPPVVTADLEGKTVIITGANTGLGFEAAKHFARMNPGRLILACRSQQKGDAALTRMCRVLCYRTSAIFLLRFEDRDGLWSG